MQQCLLLVLAGIPALSAGVEAQDLPEPPRIAPPAPPAPPRDFPPKRLTGSIDADDFPIDSFVTGESGISRVRFVVSAQGKPDNCVVINSSGSSRLDSAACEVILARFSYLPAMTYAGVSKPWVLLQSIRWRAITYASRPLLFGVKLVSEQPVGDRQLFCSFSDGVKITTDAGEKCIRTLPTAGADRPAVVAALEAEVARGDRRAAFELGWLFQNWRYPQWRDLLQSAAAKGFAPAAFELCLRLDAETPAAAAQGLAACDMAVEAGLVLANEPAAERAFRARKVLGGSDVIARLERHTLHADRAFFLLAKQHEENGDLKAALANAYVAARLGVADGQEQLANLLVNKGAGVNNLPAALVWYRRGKPEFPAELVGGLTDGRLAEIEAAAQKCLLAGDRCSAGETRLMAAAWAKMQRQRARYRAAERLDSKLPRGLGLPNTANSIFVYRINTTGNVDECAIWSSNLVFNEDRASCARLIANARYQPATVDGKPVAVWRHDRGLVGRP